MASVQQQPSGGLWSRLKRYGATTVAAFGDDVDGETEDETHVHKVLVQYYLDTYGMVPTFLGGTGQPVQPTARRRMNMPGMPGMPGGFGHGSSEQQAQYHQNAQYQQNAHQQTAHQQRSQQYYSPQPEYAQQQHLQPQHPHPHQYQQQQHQYQQQQQPTSYSPNPGQSPRRTTPKPSLQDVYQRSHASPAPSGPRASIDTVDSRRSSGESRVREKLQRRRVDPGGGAGSAGSAASQGPRPVNGRRAGGW